MFVIRNRSLTAHSAILFLAPISCFDQVLDEDPMVNRLVRSRFALNLFILASRSVVNRIGRLGSALEIHSFESTLGVDEPRAFLEQD
jgi:hypothetical protein